jgi:hypothetical protein
MGTARMSMASGMMGSDATGIWKCLPSQLSIVLPCPMEKVCSCARQVPMMMALQKMGTMASTVLACSTCVTRHCRHGFGAASFGV